MSAPATSDATPVAAEAGAARPRPAKPSWIRVRAPGSAAHAETVRIVRGHGLTTVCEEAGCPNIGECWSKRHATFMIMGDTCTRACAFCNVRTGLPRPLDPQRAGTRRRGGQGAGARRISSSPPSTATTSSDGGADHFARVITALRDASPAMTVEVLTPDFLRKDGALETVLAAASRCLQPQPRNGAAPLSVDPPRRALFPFAAAPAARQGDRPQHLHQVGHHGRPRRRARRGDAGHGRPALGRRRLSHHRPVPAAEPTARAGRALRAAR